ncbi:MAG: ribosome silencing factor [Bacillota bacterium]
MSEILELAREAAQAALEKKAKDVVILKMDDVTIITDYFVIATSLNRTQAKAIAENIEKVMKEKGKTLLSREGIREARWILLDYGVIIIHIFQEDLRKFYDLESLWGDTMVIHCEG